MNYCIMLSLAIFLNMSLVKSQNRSSLCDENTKNIEDCYGKECPPQFVKDGKRQLTSFLLSMFVGAWGAGEFYMGYIGRGIGRLVLWFGPCYLMCCAAICAAVLEGNKGGELAGVSLASCAGCIFYFCICGNIVWNTVDWIMVLTYGKVPADACFIRNI